MRYREAGDHDLAISRGSVAFAGVGLGITTGFKVTPRTVDHISVNVLTIVIALHPAVAGHKFYREHVTQPIVRGQYRPVDAVLIDKQFAAFQSEHNDIIVGVVELSRDTCRFTSGRWVMAWVISIVWAPEVVDQPALLLPLLIISRNSSAGSPNRWWWRRTGRAKDDGVTGAIDVEAVQILKTVQLRLEDFVGTPRVSSVERQGELPIGEIEHRRGQPTDVLGGGPVPPVAGLSRPAEWLGATPRCHKSPLPKRRSADSMSFRARQYAHIAGRIDHVIGLHPVVVPLLNPV